MSKGKVKREFHFVDGPDVPKIDSRVQLHPKEAREEAMNKPNTMIECPGCGCWMICSADGTLTCSCGCTITKKRSPQ